VYRTLKGQLANNLEGAGPLIVTNILMLMIGVGSIPVISRIYSPESFGSFSLLISVSSTVISVFNASIAFFIFSHPDPEKPSMLWEPFKLAVKLSLFVGLGVGLFFYFAPSLGLQWDPILFCAPMLVMMSAVMISVDFWTSAAAKKYTYIKSKLSQSFVSNIAKILSGLANPTTWSLFFGHTIGLVTALAIYTKELKKHQKQSKIKALSQDRKLAFFTKSTAIGVFNSISEEILTLFIYFYYGPVLAGQYFLGKRILNLPSEVLASAFSFVFTSKFTVNKSSKLKFRSQVLFRQILICAAAFSPIFLLLYFYSNQLFAAFLGEKWVEAGVIAGVLVIYYYFRSVAVSVKRVVFVSEALFFEFWWSFVRFVVSFLVVFWSIQNNVEAMQTFYVYGIAMAVVWGCYPLLLLVKTRGEPL